jgi:hypothetical protein
MILEKKVFSKIPNNLPIVNRIYNFYGIYFNFRNLYFFLALFIYSFSTAYVILRNVMWLIVGRARTDISLEYFNILFHQSH